MNRQFEKVDQKFEVVEGKFERLYRLLLTVSVGVVIALIGLLSLHAS